MLRFLLHGGLRNNRCIRHGDLRELRRINAATIRGRSSVTNARPSCRDARPVATVAQGEGSGTMAQSKEELHWQKTTRLMLTHLGLWVFFGYIVHMFVNVLNKITIPILGFPLGFYMAAQGSLIAFVVMLFVFAKQQDKIDREFGFAEDDE
jgi:putative solute:sodium symporter small subunit